MVAQAFGLKQDQVTIMIHCGSRGLGHQTCTDYVSMMLKKLDAWKIQLPDPNLPAHHLHQAKGKSILKQ